MGGDETTVIQAPEAPKYNESMQSILQAQINVAPQVVAMEQKYQPIYNKLQAEQQSYLANASVADAARLYPQVAAIEAKYSAANRAAELQQLQTSLPQYQKAFNSLTPGYAEALSSTGQLAQQSMSKALETPNIPGIDSADRLGGYMDFLRKSSAADLAAGKSLTTEEQRMADQSARSSYAARGTALTSQSANAEILNRADVASQRYQQRLSNAASAAGQMQSIQGQAFNEAQQRQQIQSGYAQLGAGALGQLQQAQAPILQAFYKQPILQGQVGQAQNMGLAMQQQAGPQYFNPESQTGMASIYNAYNSQTQLAAANAQAQAGASAGKSSMFGSIAGGAITGGAMIF